MTSEEEDDTLPLPGLSQEHFVDVTVDEDFIPTSQPKCFAGAKTTKMSESGTLDEGKHSDSTSTTELLPSVINDTIPEDPVADEFLNQDKSTDFIPETEMKKSKMERSEESIFCKKKLPVTEDGDNGLESHLESGWEKEISRVPESPVLETQNFYVINESLPNEDSLNESAKNSSSAAVVNKTAMTEILVNDSVETVDLDGSGNSSIKVGKKEVNVIVDSQMSCSGNMEMERCDQEETQIFDNSSVLLLDQPDPMPPSCSSFQKNGKSFVDKNSQQLYHCERIDDNEFSCHFQGQNDNSQSENSLPTIAEFSNGLDKEKCLDENVEVQKHEGVVFKQEKNSKTEIRAEESISTPLETKTMDFKLQVTCQVIINPETKKVVQKFILNVNELPKTRAKPVKVELISDNTSDKSKRYSSSSSSASVYSDKTGLPFALPKRVSNQTVTSDSSDDGGFAKYLREGKKVFERIPWSNEYLLPLKMDELTTLCLENTEPPNRTTNKSSPSKFKSRHTNSLNNLQEVSESFSSEQTSFNNSILTNGNEANDLKDASEEGHDLKEMSEKEHSDEVVNYKSSPKSKGLDEIKESNINKEGIIEEGNSEKTEMECETDERLDSLEVVKKPNISEPVCEGVNVPVAEGIKQPEKKKAKLPAEVGDDNQGDDTQLHQGLAVFARWTDKQYYSGVLVKKPKYDRWEIKFDDGSTKIIYEDFVMPSKWLKTGELVFALDNEKYAAGQIVKITQGEEVRYTVELDDNNKQVDVKISDLCLTEVMVSIVKEKYKPLSVTPGKRSADINFDNVVSGKRLRDQRTPLRPTAGVQAENSSTNKKSSKGKKESTKGSEKMKHKTDSEMRVPGLQSENGHLVPDKGISADSSSTTETGETPMRGCKEPRGKTKPRTLCYEVERYLSSRKKSKFIKEGLAPDGTPIPGPSGVNFKKLKTKAKAKQTPSGGNSGSSSPKEDVRIPARSTRSCDARATPESKILVGKNSKSTKRSAALKSSETVGKKGKRKFNMDVSEEATDDGPPAKSSAHNKTEVGRKKTKTKRE